MAKAEDAEDWHFYNAALSKQPPSYRKALMKNITFLLYHPLGVV